MAARYKKPTILRGNGASPGTVTGIARVVQLSLAKGDMPDVSQVRDGDILITHMTVPAMTPALKRVRGIVTELGGITSHAAIIAREYQIPTVMSCKGIMDTAVTGMQITLDGLTGEVSLSPAREEVS